MNYKLIIFDVDGTLVTTKSGAEFRESADDWQWLPGRRETLKALQAQGISLGIATNQGGVAFGYMRREDIIDEMVKMSSEAGMNIPVSICFSHPKATIKAFRSGDDTRRKPGPGMLNEIINVKDVRKQYTLMVGDRPEDEQAAHNAGVAFMWSEEFFKL